MEVRTQLQPKNIGSETLLHWPNHDRYGLDRERLSHTVPPTASYRGPKEAVDFRLIGNEPTVSGEELRSAYRVHRSRVSVFCPGGRVIFPLIRVRKYHETLGPHTFLWRKVANLSQTLAQHNAKRLTSQSKHVILLCVINYNPSSPRPFATPSADVAPREELARRPSTAPDSFSEHRQKTKTLW